MAMMQIKKPEYNAQDVAQMVSSIRGWMTDSHPEEIRQLLRILILFQPMYVEFRKPAKAFAQTIVLVMMAIGEIDNFEHWRHCLVYDEFVPQKSMADKVKSLPGMNSVDRVEDNMVGIVKALDWLRGCVDHTVGKHVVLANGCLVCLTDVLAHVRNRYEVLRCEAAARETHDQP